MDNMNFNHNGVQTTVDFAESLRARPSGPRRDTNNNYKYQTSNLFRDLLTVLGTGLAGLGLSKGVVAPMAKTIDESIKRGEDKQFREWATRVPQSAEERAAVNGEPVTVTNPADDPVNAGNANVGGGSDGSDSDGSDSDDSDIVEYIYLPGDTLGQVLTRLGLKSNKGLWGDDGDVAYYTQQLRDQDMLDERGNVKLGKKFILRRRK